MNAEPKQSVLIELTEPVPEGTPSAIGWVVDLILNQPLVVLVLAMGGAIYWLAKQLSARDKRIASLASVLIDIHGQGVELDENTQYTIGLKERRSKKRASVRRS